MSFQLDLCYFCLKHLTNEFKWLCKTNKNQNITYIEKIYKIFIFSQSLPLEDLTNNKLCLQCSNIIDMMCKYTKHCLRNAKIFNQYKKKLCALKKGQHRELNISLSTTELDDYGIKLNKNKLNNFKSKLIKENNIPIKIEIIIESSDDEPDQYICPSSSNVKDDIDITENFHYMNEQILRNDIKNPEEFIDELKYEEYSDFIVFHGKPSDNTCETDTIEIVERDMAQNFEPRKEHISNRIKLINKSQTKESGKKSQKESAEKISGTQNTPNNNKNKPNYTQENTIETKPVMNSNNIKEKDAEIRENTIENIGEQESSIRDNTQQDNTENSIESLREQNTQKHIKNIPNDNQENRIELQRNTNINTVEKNETEHLEIQVENIDKDKETAGIENILNANISKDDILETQKEQDLGTHEERKENITEEEKVQITKNTPSNTCIVEDISITQYFNMEYSIPNTSLIIEDKSEKTQSQNFAVECIELSQTSTTIQDECFSEDQISIPTLGNICEEKEMASIEKKLKANIPQDNILETEDNIKKLEKLEIYKERKDNVIKKERISITENSSLNTYIVEDISITQLQPSSIEYSIPNTSSITEDKSVKIQPQTLDVESSELPQTSTSLQDKLFSEDQISIQSIQPSNLEHLELSDIEEDNIICNTKYNTKSNLEVYQLVHNCKIIDKDHESSDKEDRRMIRKYNISEEEGRPTTENDPKDNQENPPGTQMKNIYNIIKEKETKIKKNSYSEESTPNNGETNNEDFLITQEDTTLIQIEETELEERIKFQENSIEQETLTTENSHKSATHNLATEEDNKENTGNGQQLEYIDVFKSAQNTEIHNKPTLKEERKFVYDICDIAFNRKSKLEKHKQLHDSKRMNENHKSSHDENLNEYRDFFDTNETSSKDNSFQLFTKEDENDYLGDGSQLFPKEAENNIDYDYQLKRRNVLDKNENKEYFVTQRKNNISEEQSSLYTEDNSKNNKEDYTLENLPPETKSVMNSNNLMQENDTEIVERKIDNISEEQENQNTENYAKIIKHKIIAFKGNATTNQVKKTELKQKNARENGIQQEMLNTEDSNNITENRNNSTLDKNNKYVCKICSSKFTRKTKLETHKKVHGSKNPKKKRKISSKMKNQEDVVPLRKNNISEEQASLNTKGNSKNNQVNPLKTQTVTNSINIMQEKENKIVERRNDNINEEHKNQSTENDAKNNNNEIIEIEGNAIINQIEETKRQKKNTEENGVQQETINNENSNMKNQESLLVSKRKYNIREDEERLSIEDIARDNQDDPLVAQMENNSYTFKEKEMEIVERRKDSISEEQQKNQSAENYSKTNINEIIEIEGDATINQIEKIEHKEKNAKENGVQQETINTENRNEVNKNQNIPTLDKNNKYVCKICSSKFTRKTKLETHKKVHGSKNSTKKRKMPIKMKNQENFLISQRKRRKNNTSQDGGSLSIEDISRDNQDHLVAQMDNNSNTFEEEEVEILERRKDGISEDQENQSTENNAKTNKNEIIAIKGDATTNQVEEIQLQEKNAKENGIQQEIINTKNSNNITKNQNKPILDKNNKYVCKICNAKFTRKTKMETHKKVHELKCPLKKRKLISKMKIQENPVSQRKNNIREDGGSLSIKDISRNNQEDSLVAQIENNSQNREPSDNATPDEYEAFLNQIETSEEDDYNTHDFQFKRKNVPLIAKNGPSKITKNQEKHVNNTTRGKTNFVKFANANSPEKDIPFTKLPKLYACVECKRQYANQGNLIHHNRVMHGSKKELLECDICHSKLSNYRSLKSHKRFVHSNLRPYKCGYCEKSFKTNFYRKEHEGVHMGNKPYTCEFCGRSFSHNSAFKRHKLRAHGNGEKPYACTKCDARFLVKEYLDNHQSVHSEERKFKCDECDMAFKRKETLRLHKLKHSNIRKFVCHVCKSKFKLNSILQKHILTHTGEKNFTCKHCKTAFTQSSTLNKHLLSHSKELTHKCDICQKKFTAKFYMDRHRAFHFNKPFSCDICKMEFTAKHNLTNHKRKHEVGILNRKGENIKIKNKKKNSKTKKK